MAVKKSDLYSSLWASCDELRGGMDASQYKDYVLFMLFIKYVSDKYGDSDDLEPPIIIPKGASFNDMAALTGNPNIGDLINTQVIQPLVDANEMLARTDFPDFNDPNKLGEGNDRVDRLGRLISIFSSPDLNFAKNRADHDDILGDAYEYLMRHFATESGKSKGQFYTPAEVSRIMAQALGIRDAETTNDTTVYDPTCGSAGMLLSAATHLKRQGKEWRNLRLYGQELNLLTSAIGRMNIFLHGIEDFRIVRGDTLAQPAFVEADRLQQFDVVLANPPYSIKQWDRDAWASDPWGRNLYGTPPQGRADYAFWQHIIQSMKAKTGRCAILFPHGVLFRNEEQAMREKLLAHDVVECVLGLGPNLFYNSPMEACVIICRMNKPKKRRNKVLFINAVNEVTRERAQSFLTEDHIARIVKAYEAFADVDGLSRVVENKTIRQQQCNLSIPLYIRAPELGNGRAAESRAEHGEGDLKQAIGAWQESSIALRESMSKLFVTLDTDGS